MKQFLLRLKQFYCLIALTLLGNFLSAQNISGKVTDSLNNPIVYANVIIKDSLNKNIIKFTTTNLEGKYQMSLKKTGNYIISFSALSYKTETKNLFLKDKNIITDVVLTEQVAELNEVIVQTDRPIVVKKDTIIYTVSAFLKGNETVVEDLLKSLPGINVDVDGTIKVGNQEIEKVMVDGDDFFKKGYKLLTKNLNADVVDKVEIYQKYSNNKLLKDVEESGKVALNLKLKKDRKVDWFGNMSLAYGLTTSNRYQARANAMRFGDVAKHYFLTNLNNIGESSGVESAIYVSMSDINEVGTIGNSQQASSLINLDSYNLSLKKTRFNFNNQELASFNSIFKINEKARLKTNAHFNWDEQAFIQNSIQNFTISSTEFINTESYRLNKQLFSGYGELDFDYDISKTKLLEIDIKYTNGDTKSKSRLDFNSIPIQQLLQNNNDRFEYKTIYTNKFAEKKVLAISGVYIYENKPQDYSVDTYIFNDLFENDNPQSVTQNSNNQMHFAGFEAHLLDRKQNDNLLEFKTGYTHRVDKLNSLLNLIEPNATIQPSGFANDFKYTVGSLYADAKYKLKLGNYSLTTKLNINQLYNHIESFDNEQSQSPLYLNPSLNFGYKINENNNVGLSYNRNFTNATLIQVFDNYILTNNRGFLKGDGGLNQVNATSVALNYSLGKWTSSFFANARVSYIKNHDFFSSNTTINPNYSLSNTILIKDTETWTAQLNIDKYLRFMHSNLKLNFNYFKSDFKNIVNDSELRIVQSSNFQYGFELRSAFDGVFNYHLGTHWNTNTIKTTSGFSNTNTTSFLDLNFNFNKAFNTEIQAERYYFGNFDRNNTYYFLDLESKYKLQKRDITVTLSGKNLFNVNTFREVFISDINTSSTTYRLLPRFILLGIDFRF